MPFPPQPALRLALSAQVALVSLDAAASAAGLHMDGALERVESGEWLWCFDLWAAGHGRIREVRVWRVCLTDPERAAGAALEAVVADALGPVAADGCVRGAALETRWRTSPATLRRLLRRGEITGAVRGKTLWLEAASLAAFLQRRRIQ